MSTLSKAELEVVQATADLVGRTGAKEFQLGWLHDDVPVENMGWYAHAQMRGARITVENQRGPVQACDALATKLLTGAKCRCGKLVALSVFGAVAYGGVMADGSRFTFEEARAAGQCRWTRRGAKWVPGCKP
jgi:hypothetical protein